jgi:dTDP-4-amino-4,6-dideoxygalactose transaminase
VSATWKILLSPPEVSDVERGFLMDAFDSNWIAPAGPDLVAFEEELGDFLGIPHVAALASGTAGLMLLLRALGVGPGDDVLVGSLTFAASAFAVAHLGARPCFVDSSPDDWHVDADLLAEELADRAARGDLPRAVIPVDLYGSVADGRRLAETCAAYEVACLADSAEALGAFRGGRHAGGWADAGILSFNGNKIVTTSGGGAVFSRRADLVERVRHLGTQARRPVAWYEHDEIGWNERLSNLSAALGRGQLRTLPERIEQRARVRRGYQDRLAAAEGIAFQPVPDGCAPNYWLTTVTIDEGSFGASRDQVLAALHAAGVEARHGFKPMHLQPVFASNPVCGGEVAAGLFETSVSFPSGSRLSDSDLDFITDVALGARRR